MPAIHNQDIILLGWRIKTAALLKIMKGLGKPMKTMQNYPKYQYNIAGGFRYKKKICIWFK